MLRLHVIKSSLGEERNYNCMIKQWRRETLIDIEKERSASVYTKGVGGERIHEPLVG